MNKKSDKCRFKSRYGGGYLSDSQYIMEVFCENLARQKKVELPDYFWKVEPWNKLFREQIPAAVNLVKKFPVEVVSAALKDYNISSKLKSLRANYMLKPVLQEKYREWKMKNREVTEERKKTSTTEKPRGGLNSGKSLMEQLKDL